MNKCEECYECSFYAEFGVCNGYDCYCGKKLNGDDEEC